MYFGGKVLSGIWDFVYCFVSLPLRFFRKNRKRIYMTNVTTKLGVEAYETPSCSVVEICFEGVLCTSNTSGGFSHQGIDGDDESIF